MAKIPILIIKSMGNASNIINSVFTIFFILTSLSLPSLNDNLSDITNRIFISEMGTVASKNVPPQGSADTNITFKKTYNNPPIVLITPTYIAAGISAGVANITTTGCLISICNMSASARNVPANYIVISRDSN